MGGKGKKKAKARQETEDEQLKQLVVRYPGLQFENSYCY